MLRAMPRSVPLAKGVFRIRRCRFRSRCFDDVWFRDQLSKQPGQADIDFFWCGGIAVLYVRVTIVSVGGAHLIDEILCER